MNVSDQIITVFDDLCRRFGIVIDWTNETILPYLEELAKKLIIFETKTSWFWIILASSIVVIFWILSLIFATTNGFDSDSAIFFCVASTLLTVIAIIIDGAQIYDIITCETFPEKILLREIKELIQSSRFN